MLKVWQFDVDVCQALISKLIDLSINIRGWGGGDFEVSNFKGLLIYKVHTKNLSIY